MNIAIFRLCAALPRANGTIRPALIIFAATSLLVNYLAFGHASAAPPSSTRFDLVCTGRMDGGSNVVWNGGSSGQGEASVVKKPDTPFNPRFHIDLKAKLYSISLAGEGRTGDMTISEVTPTHIMLDFVAGVPWVIDRRTGTFNSSTQSDNPALPGLNVSSGSCSKAAWSPRSATRF